LRNFGGEIERPLGDLQFDFLWQYLSVGGPERFLERVVPGFRLWARDPKSSNDFPMPLRGRLANIGANRRSARQLRGKNRGIVRVAFAGGVGTGHLMSCKPENAAA